MEEKKTTTKKATAKKKKVDEPNVTTASECICDANVISSDYIEKMNLENELASKNEELALIKERLEEEKVKCKKLDEICKLHEKKESELTDECRTMKSRLKKQELTNKDLDAKIKTLQGELDELHDFLALPWYKRLFK